MSGVTDQRGRSRLQVVGDLESIYPYLSRENGYTVDVCVLQCRTHYVTNFQMLVTYNNPIREETYRRYV